MVECFSSFTYTLFLIGFVLALGIIFEEKLIQLEDKFDMWIKSKFKHFEQEEESEFYEDLHLEQQEQM